MVPVATAFRIRSKSGTDAKRHTPRYSPNAQNAAPWTGTSTGSAIMHASQ